MAAISASGKAQRWTEALLSFQQLLQQSLAPGLERSKPWRLHGEMMGYSWDNHMKISHIHTLEQTNDDIT